MSQPDAALSPATDDDDARVTPEGDEPAASSTDAVEQEPDAPPTRDGLLRTLLGARRLALGTTARDRAWSAVGTLLVVALAAASRLYELGRPGKLVFDETYYVKEGWSFLRFGYEISWPENANASWETGNPDVYQAGPEYVVHPPVGKWMIALGMRLMGGASDPLSWRLGSALVGILAVFLIIRIARRLFASTAMGLVAGLLLAVDGEAIVHSRTGLLDQFLMFWVLVAFGCLVMDREWARRRLADRVASVVESGGVVGLYGPPLGFRWWRLATAVALGLACGTKWSGLYFVAVFGIMTVVWDLTARRAAGVRRWWEDALVSDGLPAILLVLPTIVVVYVATWSGWLFTRGAYMRDWAEVNGVTGPSWFPEWAQGAWGALRSLWEYHVSMYGFHVGLDVEHSYKAHPIGWILQWRPTSFFWETYAPGSGPCPADRTGECAVAITSLGNPLLWWLSALMIPVAIYLVIRFRDWRGTAVLLGTAAGWLPWFLYSLPVSDRTIFAFYSIVFTPFVVLTLVYAFTVWLERTAPGSGREHGRTTAVATITTVVVAIVVVGALYYPVWTAIPVPYEYWHRLMILPSWI